MRNVQSLVLYLLKMRHSSLKTMLLLIIAKMMTTATASQNAITEPAQQFKWFVLREDCYDAFVNKLDFSNPDCIKFTLSKIVGYLIIAGSGILKVPQILKILKNQSVEGISKMMFYLEVTFTWHNPLLDINVRPYKFLQHAQKDAFQRLRGKPNHFGSELYHCASLLGVQQEDRNLGEASVLCLHSGLLHLPIPGPTPH
jgi:hypothetical protein